jgi:hypothetical protein
MKFRALIVIAVVLASGLALAQQAGSITGIVRDAGIKVLPGVTVEVSGPDAGTESRTAVTDAQGRYTVGDLRPGAYTVTFRLPGFRTQARNFVGVVASSATTLDISLGVDAAATQLFRYRPPTPPRPQFEFTPPSARGQTREGCLHGADETPAEQQRRREALSAVRLIYGLLERVPVNPRGYPDWDTLARSKAVADLKSTNALAKKMQWGTSEPLPGWRITYEAGGTIVRFALTDTTDPCSFTYSSDDPDVMPWGNYGRVIPLAPQ